MFFAFLLEFEWPRNTFVCKADAGIRNEPNRRDSKYLCFGSAVCWVHVLGLVSGPFTVLALGSLHVTATCLTGRRSRSEALVSSQRPTAFVCAEKKKKKKRKWDGPKWTRGGYLLLANRHRPRRWCTHFAFVAWQLAFIPWHRCVCSHCDLLLNLICALKLLAASRLDGGIRKRNSPPARLCFERDGESVLQRHWSGLNWYKWTCFLSIANDFLWSGGDSFQAPLLQCSSSAPPDLLMFFFVFFHKAQMVTLWQGLCCAAWTYFA